MRLPLCAAPASHLGAPPPPNFWAFLAARLEVDPAASEDQTAAIGEAVIGLAGMIRFGNHASPILHEALSDLLLADFQQDAKGLAARALLRAADSCGDAEAAAAYREKARMALSLQTPESGESRGLTVEELEANCGTGTGCGHDSKCQPRSLQLEASADWLRCCRRPHLVLAVIIHGEWATMCG